MAPQKLKNAEEPGGFLRVFVTAWIHSMAHPLTIDYDE
jgi:hypothetical protein